MCLISRGGGGVHGGCGSRESEKVLACVTKGGDHDNQIHDRQIHFAHRREDVVLVANTNNNNPLLLLLLLLLLF